MQGHSVSLNGFWLGPVEPAPRTAPAPAGGRGVAPAPSPQTNDMGGCVIMIFLKINQLAYL